MRHPTDAFLAANPVCAVVLLPAWYRSPDAGVLEEAFRAITPDYTVTSNPRMALQVVLRLKAPDGTGAPDTVRVRFGGFHAFALDLAPWPRPAEEPSRPSP
jgi:hypothetical protein